MRFKVCLSSLLRLGGALLLEIALFSRSHEAYILLAGFT